MELKPLENKINAKSRFLFLYTHWTFSSHTSITFDIMLHTLLLTACKAHFPQTQRSNNMKSCPPPPALILFTIHDRWFVIVDLLTQKHKPRLAYRLEHSTLTLPLWDVFTSDIRISPPPVCVCLCVLKNLLLQQNPYLGNLCQTLFLGYYPALGDCRGTTWPGHVTRQRSDYASRATVEFRSVWITLHDPEWTHVCACPVLVCYVDLESSVVSACTFKDS